VGPSQNIIFQLGDEQPTSVKSMGNMLSTLKSSLDTLTESFET
jgi:hypothetical protein